MLLLLVVSLIWGFSFGLIKNNLGGIDASLVAAIRLGISLLVFVPFFRPRAVPDRGTAARLLLSGAVQYGLMYVAYLYAFAYLKAYEVALFTVFTPLYVTLAEDLLKRRMALVSLAAAGLTVAGAWVVKSGGQSPSGLLTGFLIVQVSNLCFAAGQIYYRHILTGRAIADRQIFALPYLGGMLTAAAAALLISDRSALVIGPAQWQTLLFLGVISSGLCFFLWNVGARQVDAGTLAIMNDLKIPLAILVSLVFFGEQTDLPRLVLGGGVMLLALLLNTWGRNKQLPIKLSNYKRPAN